MRTYSVHIRRHGPDAEPVFALVKEGFNWPAFFFNIFWALWRRLWLVAIGLVAISLAIAIIAKAIGLALSGQAVLIIGWSVIVGMLANDVRRYYLSCEGFIEEGIAAGKNSDYALFDYLRDTAGLPKNISGFML